MGAQCSKSMGSGVADPSAPGPRTSQSKGKSGSKKAVEKKCVPPSIFLHSILFPLDYLLYRIRHVLVFAFARAVARDVLPPNPFLVTNELLILILL